MFVPYRVSVQDYLKAGSNELLLTFQSAFLKVQPISLCQVDTNLFCFIFRVKTSKSNTENSLFGTVIPAVSMSARHNTSEISATPSNALLNNIS